MLVSHQTNILLHLEWHLVTNIFVTSLKGSCLCSVSGERYCDFHHNFMAMAKMAYYMVK